MATRSNHPRTSGISSVLSIPASTTSSRALLPGSAKTNNFHVVRFDEQFLPTLCLARIGQSDRFCVSTKCQVQSHKRRGYKFEPLLNHYYMPAENLSAASDTFIAIDAVPSKYQNQFDQGLMLCPHWSHSYLWMPCTTSPLSSSKIFFSPCCGFFDGERTH